MSDAVEFIAMNSERKGGESRYPLKLGPQGQTGSSSKKVAVRVTCSSRRKSFVAVDGYLC